MSRYARMLLAHLPNEVELNPIAITHRGALLRKYRALRQVLSSGTGGDVWHFETQDMAALLNLAKFGVTVVTVHDLVVPFYPKLYPIDMPLSLDARIFVGGLKKASRVIAVTDFQKGEVSRLVGIPADRIRAIHHGMGPPFVAPSHEERQRLRSQLSYSDGDSIVMYAGSEQPRKNFSLLIQAMPAVIDEVPTARLVKVGYGERPEWRAATESLIKRLGLEVNVIFAGHLPNDAAVSRYLKAADVFVFPSVYEGFGFPPLEAMACGVPTIVGQAAAVREVVGGAALEVSGTNHRSLADAIVRVLSDEKLRASLVARGVRRAADFDWKKCAREHVTAYEETVHDTP